MLIDAALAAFRPPHANVVKKEKRSRCPIGFDSSFRMNLLLLRRKRLPVPRTGLRVPVAAKYGIDDCSTDLSLRGLPVFRGLIGPMPESKEVVRYEAPEVFESLTKEWGVTPTKRKPRRRAARR